LAETNSETAGARELVVQKEPKYVVRGRERRRIGKEIKGTIQGVGDKIYTEAAKQHNVEGGQIDWSSWSIGTLELQTPIELSELKGEFPILAHALSRPVGEVQQRKDAIDDESAVTKVGYWNNSDAHYIAIQLRLKGGSADPEAVREISIEGGFYLGKSWKMSMWRNSTRNQSVLDYRILSNAADEADKLVDKIISSGKFKATLVSRTQRME